MKKLLFLSALVIFLGSCSKDSPSIPDPVTAPKISAVPSSFIQKVLIENFTMTTCGQCPKYEIMLDSLVEFNPDRVFAMTHHVNDIMSDTSLLTTNGGNYYDSLFNPSQFYPSGMVNRKITSLSDIMPDNWPSSVYSTLGYMPSCGVAIEAEEINNGNLHMIVHVGFSSSLAGQYNIHAFLVQDQVVSSDSLYDQLNDYSYEGATPDTNLSLYPLNDTIHQYRHQFVMKKVISDKDGDPIPLGSTFAGNHITAGYNLDLTGVDLNNAYILVFVDKYATTGNGHRIANVQYARIGTTKDWN